MAKLIVSLPLEMNALARVIASLSEPAPVSAVVVTTKLLAGIVLAAAMLGPMAALTGGDS